MKIGLLPGSCLVATGQTGEIAGIDGMSQEDGNRKANS